MIKYIKYLALLLFSLPAFGQIDVNLPPYNAYGDCQHDDSAAFAAARDKAMATNDYIYVHSACYKASIDWYGVSVLGPERSGPGGPNTHLTIIQGLPGKDVFHVPDPTTTMYPWWQDWAIENIKFVVDNSVPSNYPHRYPGRWFDDASMAAGSTVLKAPSSSILCGDIGQAIKVTGAGPMGTDLVTTIANVSPCWASSNMNWQTITLAAAASSPVSNVHAYVSVLNLPVDATIGPCAIAFDDMDGNPANWVNKNLAWIGGNPYDNLHNVAFASTNRDANACGIYTQGGWGPYGLDVHNFEFRDLEYGVVYGTSERNSFYQSSSNDFQTWFHGSWEQVKKPWISYNGGAYDIEGGIELTTDYGMQFLALSNKWYDGPGGTLHIGEFEGGTGPIGFRLVGSWNLDGTSLTGSYGQVAYLDISGSECRNCNSGGTVYIDGSGNHLGFSSFLPVVNRGLFNEATAYHNPNPLMSIFAERTLNLIPVKKDDPFLFWPQDMLVNSYGQSGVWEQFFQYDTSSPSGSYMIVHAGNGMGEWQQFLNSNSGGFMIAGQEIPAAPAVVSFYAKCPAGQSSATFAVGVFSFDPGYNYGYQLLWSKKIACTTSYQLYSLPIDLTKWPKGNVIFQSLDNPIYAAWVKFKSSRASVP